MTHKSCLSVESVTTIYSSVTVSIVFSPLISVCRCVGIHGLLRFAIARRYVSLAIYVKLTASLHLAWHVPFLKHLVAIMTNRY